MFIAARVRDPETRKAGAPTPTFHICLHSSDRENSRMIGQAQYPVLVPRIIATHWLRPDPMEAHDG